MKTLPQTKKVSIEFQK